MVCWWGTRFRTPRWWRRTGIEAAVEAALQQAEQAHVTGKEVTPFLLSRVVELTGGDSLQANIALIEHNAQVGAAIAIAYADLQRGLPPSSAGA